MRTAQEMYAYYLDKAEYAHRMATQHFALSAKAAEDGDFVTSMYENKIGVWMENQAHKWEDNADQLANAMK